MTGAKWINNLFNNRTVTSRPSAHPWLEALEDRFVPAPLVVTSAADSGAGTLRAAITTANRTPGLVTIDFAIGTAGSARTINLTSALPAVSATVLIDGTSQGGSGYSGPPLIELNGTRAGVGASGLVLTGNNGTIEGLSIDHFAQDGILLRGNATGNTIGGSTAGTGNVISGNGNDGVEVVGTGAMNNLIEGNLIGTNSGGTAAVANRFDGVLIRTGASGNTVGGTASGAGNVISGNGNDGIEVVGSGTVNNLIQGNTIGAQSDGASDLGNGANGVAVRNFAGHNTIGGTETGAGNVIAFNGGDGVLIGDTVAGLTAGTGNSIEDNSIFGNHRLGIFLGFDNTSRPPVVLANDSKGHPAVNNSYQDYPALSTPQVTTDSTILAGTLSSPNNPKTTFRIEFFANDSADSTGFGQGKVFLGAVTVTTNASGKASFSLTLPTRLAGGQVISATATDALGNTSEFSRDVTVA